MSKITGVVEGVSTKYGKFSVLVGGTWYGTKEEWAPNPRPTKGDTIEFDSKGGKYLNACKIVGGGVSSSPSPAPSSGGAKSGGGYVADAFPIPATHPKRTINRQNALTAAVNYVGNMKALPSPEDVVEIARVFEAYTTGEADQQEKDEIMKAILSTEE